MISEWDLLEWWVWYIGLEFTVGWECQHYLSVRQLADARTYARADGLVRDSPYF